MTRADLLACLGWPQDVESGSLSWLREDNERHGTRATLTLSPNGDLVMSSQSHFNGRTQPRFNAHAPSDKNHARVSMPGYEASEMPIAQAVSLFRAHVDSMQVKPAFSRGNGPSLRV